MYLEILGKIRGSLAKGGNCVSERRAFVGPFDSEEQRDRFSQSWGIRLNCDGNEVKFTPRDVLPEFAAVLPVQDIIGLFSGGIVGEDVLG